MGKKKRTTVDHLAAHSLAKVRVIVRYLAAYLNILERAPNVKEVHILDLMCGEGVYADGNCGTAVEIVREVLQHFNNNDSATTNRIKVWLNDFAKSDIDEGLLKIERVTGACEPIAENFPPHITIEYSHVDAIDRCFEIIKSVGPDNAKRFLIILDQRGYKQIPATTIKRLMDVPGVEVILFFPIGHMYRFANASGTNPSPGSEPLRALLHDLKIDNVMFKSAAHFLRELAHALGEYVGDNAYSSPIVLEAASNDYAILYLTKSERGIEVMVDEKWNLDRDQGLGYRRGMNQGTLFADQIELFEEHLANYIRDSPSGRTNREIMDFALRNSMNSARVGEILHSYGNRLLITEIPSGKPSRHLYLSRDGRKMGRVTIRLVTDLFE